LWENERKCKEIPMGKIWDDSEDLVWGLSSKGNERKMKGNGRKL
jgi:hypothetical protein